MKSQQFLECIMNFSFLRKVGMSTTNRKYNGSASFPDWCGGYFGFDLELKLFVIQVILNDRDFPSTLLTLMTRT